MRREMHAPALRDLGVFYPGRTVDGTTASSGVEWATMQSLWTLLHSERKYSDRLISVDRDRYRLEKNGRTGDFTIIRTFDWINVIPVTEEGNFVFIRQFRHGIREVTLEIPGGAIDPSDSSPRVDRDRPVVPAGDRHGATERGCPPRAGPRRVRAVLRGGVRSALMDLWLVRHGEAVPEREDPAGPLSPEGALAIRAIVEPPAGARGPSPRSPRSLPFSFPTATPCDWPSPRGRYAASGSRRRVAGRGSCSFSSEVGQIRGGGPG